MAHISSDQLCARQPHRRAGAWAALHRAIALHRQRRALARLSSAQLQDIGLTKAQALAESRRAAWDVPAHWRA